VSNLQLKALETQLKESLLPLSGEGCGAERLREAAQDIFSSSCLGRCGYSMPHPQVVSGDFMHCPRVLRVQVYNGAINPAVTVWVPVSTE
jgi:hypothetical protein